MIYFKTSASRMWAVSAYIESNVDYENEKKIRKKQFGKKYGKNHKNN